MIDVGTNLNSSKPFLKKYYKILTKDYPDFLDQYIQTFEMQHLEKSSISCGCNYTNLYDLKFMLTNLNHSVGVALIIWHFTRDKKQTLAGLFHDIATPAFKHCIDFMNGDYEKQESTEEKTEAVILNSKEIMDLLQKDNIKLEEVVNYKIYPIADNETPELSADRLEYTLTNGVFWIPVWTMEELEKIYNDLTITKNESNIDELAFKSLDVAEMFINKASVLWPSWINNKDKITMQFIADTISKMEKGGYIKIQDLYVLSEIEIIDKIIKCPDEKIAANFLKFVNSTEIIESEEIIPNKYCKSIKSKKRYINPLVITDSGPKRITDISEKSDIIIRKYLKFQTPKYGCLDITI